MTIWKTLFAIGLGSVIALSANAGPFHGIHDMYSGRDLDAQGITFQNTLYQGYADLSHSRLRGWDLRDSEHFNHKARTSARRSAVQPDQLDDRRLGDDDATQLYAALGRLYRVFDGGGRMLASVETGTAQVNFDCWIEAAEGRRDDDVARCKDAFEQAMAGAESMATIDPTAIHVVLAEPGGATAAAMPVAINYLVFFDWDSAVLTQEAVDIVAAAAQAVRDGGIARIAATGHADRSGPAEYNIGLSQNRAEAVRAELVRQGLAEDTISIFARGEADPLVPTDDGVREPQNRRVEIGLN
jgi:OOP family OmpA-OmpF porin